jgi:hypothetical protein
LTTAARFSRARRRRLILRAYRIPGNLEDLNALRLIFLVNERAGFDFVLSEASLDGVIEKKILATRDGRSTCLTTGRIAESPGSTFEGSRRRLAARLGEGQFQYLPVQDGRLARDAIELECDAFQTIERKLVRNAGHLPSKLGIKVNASARTMGR